MLTVQLLIAPFARVEHQRAPAASPDDGEAGLYDPRTTGPERMSRTDPEQEET